MKKRTLPENRRLERRWDRKAECPVAAKTLAVRSVRCQQKCVSSSARLGASRATMRGSNYLG